MTVKELKEELSQFPQDMEVRLNVYNTFRNITKVVEAKEYRFKSDGKGWLKGQEIIKVVAIQ